MAKKSGDSKLQDAARARQAEHQKSSQMTGKDQLESTVEEVQDSAEQARMIGAAPAVVDEKERAIRELTTLVSSLTRKVESLESGQATLSTARTGAVKQGRVYLKCSTCMQVTPGVCQGTHKMVFVAPQLMDLWPSFQGVTINGVTYSGAVNVPPSIEQNVMSACRRWETRERRKFIPGGKIFGEDKGLGMQRAAMFG